MSQCFTFDTALSTGIHLDSTRVALLGTQCPRWTLNDRLPTFVSLTTSQHRSIRYSDSYRLHSPFHSVTIRSVPPQTWPRFNFIWTQNFPDSLFNIASTLLRPPHGNNLNFGNILHSNGAFGTIFDGFPTLACKAWHYDAASSKSWHKAPRLNFTNNNSFLGIRQRTYRLLYILLRTRKFRLFSNNLLLGLVTLTLCRKIRGRHAIELISYLSSASNFSRVCPFLLPERKYVPSVRSNVNFTARPPKDWNFVSSIQLIGPKRTLHHESRQVRGC